jgi:hypothetical protein
VGSVARVSFARIVLFAVMVAPVVRAMCDVNCLHIPEPAPPPCHGSAPDEPSNDGECSHDHDRIVARLASPSIEQNAAILPAVVLPVTAPLTLTVYATGDGRPLAPRASPRTILRV